MNYLRLLFTAPARAWAWGQSHPFEAIGYGLIVLLGAWIARPLLVVVAAAAILSGLKTLFLGETK